MLALAIKLVLVLAVMFGGAGVTAAAAQSSLPNEALYPVKLLVEEVQLSLAPSPTRRSMCNWIMLNSGCAKWRS